MARTAATPSLADAIAANIPARGPRCGVALLRELLDDRQRTDLASALANRAIPASAIAKGLQAVGHTLPELTVQRHRRNACSCR